MSIFIVDDHPLMSEAVATLLGHLYPFERIVEFGSVAGPLTSEDSGLLLICLDLNMPGISGCAGIRALKEHFPTVPLVVYSASRAGDEERDCSEAGADAYIEKSIGSRELATTLRRILSRQSSAVALAR
ncbi:response regulator transcription factor [Variovorax sp. H27-G14]|uniref:response regulator n=1 Tax=Variovorax sp. H27-G14 TaxID=3111914 RepID=UPI0038FC5D18